MLIVVLILSQDTGGILVAVGGTSQSTGVFTGMTIRFGCNYILCKHSFVMRKFEVR